MTTHLKPEELTSFKGAFDMFDRNADGTISTKVRALKKKFVLKSVKYTQ